MIMHDMTIEPIISDRERFRNYIKTQKCPFRIKTVKFTSGIEEQKFMNCDPDCIALIIGDDYETYGCLRCVNAQLNAHDEWCYMYHDFEEEEDNAG